MQFPPLCPAFRGPLLSAGLLLCAAAAPAAEPAPDLDARFASAEGWLGADGIYAVTLPGDRTAWLFSDTWTGAVRDGRRANPRMINNSVGITAGAGPARFFYPAAADGQPAALYGPAAGAVVRKPPLLRWKKVAGATFYNVQLYRNGRKVLSTWPGAAKLRLKRTWTYAGKPSSKDQSTQGTDY